MRLLAVELTRFGARRAVALLVVAAVVLAAVLAISTAWNTRPLTAEDRRDAAAQAALEGEKPEIQQQVAACEDDPAAFLGPSATAAECEDAMVPGPEAYQPRQALSLEETLSPGGMGLRLSVVVIALMVIAGCTFAGADWASRSMTNQLLFEPRRWRVWVAKAAAVALAAGLVTALTLGGYWLTLGLLAEARQLDVSATVLGDVGWHLLRATVLGSAAATGAFALTMLFRHTVATLAVLFVYSIGGEIAINLLPVDGASRWSLGNNVLGWLATRYEYYDATLACTPGEDCSPMAVMTHLEGGAFLGVLFLVAVVVSVLAFRFRDV